MRFADKKYKIFLLLGVSGILTGLTLIFPKIAFIEWLSLVPMALVLFELSDDKTVKLRHIYLYGLYFFDVFYVMAYHWFVNLYPFEFIDGMTKGSALIIVLLAVFGLSFLQALVGAAAFLFAAWLFRTPIFTRYTFFRPLLMGGIWAVFEWSQNFGWWVMPWARLPIGQSEFVIGLQTASWFGSYFVTFIIVAVNFFAAYGIFALLSKDGEGRSKKIRLAAIACGVLLLFQYGAGLGIYLVSEKSEGGDTITVGAAQGNFPSGEKWDTDTEEKILKVYGELTIEAAKNGAEVVVFPETAFPWTVKEGSGRHKFLAELARVTDVTLLVGCFTYGEDGSEYNSVICVTPDGEMNETVYTKRHLVPFGEYVPMGAFIETVFPPLANLIMSGSDLAEGEGAKLFLLEEGKIGSLICFDSIYEDAALESVRAGAQVLCLSTNDSWFTDSAALYMHRAQGQLRAIECGRYVVRSANTGLTCIINNRGETVYETEPHKTASLSGHVEMRSGRTLYSYIGNSFVYLWVAVLFVLVILSVVSKLREKRHSSKDFM